MLTTRVSHETAQMQTAWFLSSRADGFWSAISDGDMDAQLDELAARFVDHRGLWAEPTQR